MRESGVRAVPIYCRDYRCGHHTEANADGWADDVRISSRSLPAPNAVSAAPRSGRSRRRPGRQQRLMPIIPPNLSSLHNAEELLRQEAHSTIADKRTSVAD
jgi:hypothetical protein